MMRRIVPLMLLAALTGCPAPENSPPDPPATPATPAPSATGSDSDNPPVTSSGARSVSEETDDYLFEYSYPAEAGNIPELAALLDKRLDNTRQELAREAARDREEARDNGFPFNKYSSSVAWKVVADTPGWLSLSSDLQNYTGGAHGNYGFGAIVWDKQAKAAMRPADLFLSPAALDEALGERFCADLNAERLKRRETPPGEGDFGSFEECVSVSEVTIIAGSAGGRAFDRIGLMIGPYVAGPYAEGSYEFTYPVTAAVLEAVKPEYRASFAARN